MQLARSPKQFGFALALVLSSGALACGNELETATEQGSETDGDGSETDGDGSETDDLNAEPRPPNGRLVIDEVYFTGSPPVTDADHYFSDQFIALRNVSDEPVAAGGLLIGDVFGVAGEINPGNEPHGLAEDDSYVYMQTVWMIPGAPEDVVIEPGARLVIAQDGVNHSPFSSVDLSGADFEAYVAESGKDEDYSTVANLELVHDNTGFDWLITVFGPSIVIASLGDDELAMAFEFEGWQLLQLPASAVVDGVDIVKDGDSGAFKRLPPAIDRGFTFASGTYTGEAVVRRRVDGRSIDTDDSSSDFELTDAPMPWR